jgi:hypothetical protein
LFEIHVTVVVGDDLPHATHLTEGDLRKECFGFGRKSAGGLTDDFETPKNRILLLGVRHESFVLHVLKIAPNDKC